MKYEIDKKAFEALNVEDKITFAKDWFCYFHSDPVQEMPRLGGEFHYPYGGPYDTSDEIYGHFDGLLNEDQIVEIVDDLEADGTFVWAPSGSHPDQERARDNYLLEEHEWLLKTSIHYETRDALVELEQFLQADKNVPVGSLKLRMAFIQCWSVLEAYLGNTLTKHAQENPKIFVRLSDGLEAIRDNTFSIRDLAKDPNAPLKMLITHLQRVLFYDPKRIRGYVQIAFGKFETAEIDIKQEMATFANMRSARHDCVHRNGKSVDGSLSTLSQEDVVLMLGTVRSYVDKVEQLIDGSSPEEDIF